MSGLGCDSCKRTNMPSGTCTLCGRRWGGCAPLGVEEDSPCPQMMGGPHSWFHQREGNPLCSHCKQRMMIDGEAAALTEATIKVINEGGLPEDPIERLQLKLLVVCATYNDLGAQIRDIVDGLQNLKGD